MTSTHKNYITHYTWDSEFAEYEAEALAASDDPDAPLTPRYVELKRKYAKPGAIVVMDQGMPRAMSFDLHWFTSPAKAKDSWPS